MPPQVVQSADVIFVAVKPQYVSVVLAEVAPHLQDRHTIVSIAAGVTLHSLKVGGLRHGRGRSRREHGQPARTGSPPSRHPACGVPQEAAGEGVRLVRVMPNTPCLVGETAAAM